MCALSFDFMQIEFETNAMTSATTNEMKNSEMLKMLKNIQLHTWNHKYNCQNVSKMKWRDATRCRSTLANQLINVTSNLSQFIVSFIFLFFFLSPFIFTQSIAMCIKQTHKTNWLFMQCISISFRFSIWRFVKKAIVWTNKRTEKKCFHRFCWRGKQIAASDKRQQQKQSNVYLAFFFHLKQNWNEKPLKLNFYWLIDQASNSRWFIGFYHLKLLADCVTPKERNEKNEKLSSSDVID